MYHKSNCSNKIISLSPFELSTTNIMLVLRVLILFLPIILADVYQPGTPGAPWSEEEMLTVKSKLLAIFRRGGGYEALRTIYPPNTPGPFESGSFNGRWSRVPDAPKFLRLGFHDCLKYDDGTGGCDGCLNWHGVGFRFDDAPNEQKYPDIKETNNNGLEYTVQVLEEIYKNKDFPANAPSLSVSLRDSGKSRADLWAYSTVLAVEYGVETNNRVCDDPTVNDPGHQCHHQQGLEGCKINLGGKMITFKTGRSDCTEFESEEEPYKATKTEVHPNAVGNGEQTVDFFASQFGLSGPEMVALLGAHTFGRFHVHVSLFRYTWTSRGTHLLNNHYYKNIVLEDEYFFNDNKCTKVTDAWGNKPKTKWKTHVRADTPNGGPVHWIHFNYVCPNCVQNPGKNCCGIDNPNPEVNFCRPDPGRETYHPSAEGDNNVNHGCEAYRFISGVDEMALSCEMGLYYDFKVTEDGIPYGCPGFHDGWVNNASRIAGHRWAEPTCPKNMMSVPEGASPLSTMFDTYAADQEKWYTDFVDVLEKMLDNGYDASSLQVAPDHVTNVICPRQNPNDWRKFYNCYHDIEGSTYFRIVSQLDGRALFGSEDGFVTMQGRNETCQGQLWYTVDNGNQIINKETKLALRAGGGASWVLNGDVVALDDNDRIIDMQGRALDRGWNQKDGATPGIYTPHQGPNQKWSVEIVV